MAKTRRRKSADGKAEIAKFDRNELRTALRRLGSEYVLHMLVDAIELLPRTKQARLVGRYLDLTQLRSETSRKKNLLAEVRAFNKDCRAGKYYEGFDVNSKNFMDKSEGTEDFIDDCNRLLDRCVAQAHKGDARETGEAFEIILQLLKYMDEGNDDVLFFPDEGGSWMVGVEWAKVFPALFRCLAQTANPDEYARRVVEPVDYFEKRNRTKHLAAARRLGSAAQREALRSASTGLEN